MMKSSVSTQIAVQSWTALINVIALDRADFSGKAF